MSDVKVDEKQRNLRLQCETILNPSTVDALFELGNECLGKQKEPEEEKNEIGD